MPDLEVSVLPATDVLHGICVPDPFRGFESRSLPATEQWIRDQQVRCTRYFSQCSSLPAIRTRVREYLDVTMVDQPVRIGKQYFYRRRALGEEQASIYVRDSETSEERLLVAAPSDIFASVRIHSLSPRGTLLAYELREGGTDRRTIHVVDVEAENGLDTAVDADWFRGLVFAERKRGFFYCQDRVTYPDEHTVRWHSLGDTTNDHICFRAPKTPSSRLILTCDATHLGILHLNLDEEIEVLDFWIAKLDDSIPLSWIQVFHKRQLPFSPLLSHGRIFAKVQGRDGNYRYAEFDCNGREVRAVIPELPGRICQVMTVQGGFVVNRFHEGQFETHWWSLDGNDRGTLSLPRNTTVILLPPLAGAQQSLFLTSESFDHSPSIYEFTVEDGAIVRTHSSSTKPSNAITIERDGYAARDGLNIPITLASTADTVDQKAPCLMTAYGGFGVPGTPQFSVLVTILLELGVRFALPHIRGGGDFGTSWHEAGRRRQRQTAIDDFLAAGDWLYEQGHVSHQGLAIFGGSNSGLLVGASITQRPDLFRAALCIAPLLDMVRYEQFDRAARWYAEYGTVRDEADFLALHSYSPYHHIRENQNYPATLFVTGDRDDRCNPAHVRKMAAALQNREMQSNPIIVDYSAERGHMPVLPLSIRVEALARRIAFLCRELNLTIPSRW